MNPINKMTVNQFPALMGTINNIQVLQKDLNIKNPLTFEVLENMTGESLFLRRDQLVFLYQSMVYVLTFKN